MARIGKPVYKFDSTGQLVHAFANIQEVCLKEGINMHHLYAAIRAERQINRAFYSFIPDAGRVLSDETESCQKIEATPWEKDGFFNIDGWATVYKI